MISLTCVLLMFVMLAVGVPIKAAPRGTPLTAITRESRQALTKA